MGVATARVPPRDRHPASRRTFSRPRHHARLHHPEQAHPCEPITPLRRDRIRLQPRSVHATTIASGDEQIGKESRSDAPGQRDRLLR
jgi:hypothetical protein